MSQLLSRADFDLQDVNNVLTDEFLRVLRQHPRSPSQTILSWVEKTLLPNAHVLRRFKKGVLKNLYTPLFSTRE